VGEQEPVAADVLHRLVHLSGQGAGCPTSGMPTLSFADLTQSLSELTMLNKHALCPLVVTSLGRGSSSRTWRSRASYVARLLRLQSQADARGRRHPSGAMLRVLLRPHR